MVMISWLLDKFPPQRLLRFIVTGGTALAIDMAIYFVLTRYGHLYYLWSRVISLAVAIIWNFTVNRQWTFRAVSGDVMIQVSRFLAVILVTSLANLMLMHVGISYLHLNDLFVLVFVSGFITIFNFTAHSFWSYAEKNN